MKTALLLLLLGCGYPEAPAAFNYDSRQFHFHSATPIDADRTDFNVDLLCGMLTSAGIALCPEAGQIDVDLIDGNFKGADGRQKAGVDVPFHNLMFIQLHEGHLMHECLHLWDFQHLAIGSAWHQGWDSNGYDALDKAFQKRAHWVAPAARSDVLIPEH